jgi:hypothetical protein
VLFLLALKDAKNPQPAPSLHHSTLKNFATGQKTGCNSSECFNYVLTIQCNTDYNPYYHYKAYIPKVALVGLLVIHWLITSLPVAAVKRVINTIATTATGSGRKRAAIKPYKQTNGLNTSTPVRKK